MAFAKIGDTVFREDRNSLKILLAACQEPITKRQYKAHSLHHGCVTLEKIINTFFLLQMKLNDKTSIAQSRVLLLQPYPVW